ncbi:MAG TPA: 2-C-methyl-D-erythritol 4-phosphate cytidylyltransferase [Candidatus Cloacimonadota bacterium]|jgi:2-C-methyl-D-erythritol 4-phosphate cytidylyltransferase|nr:2-C-methyl-D-erythritol 4-phosphate cytidylyltransferase [Candidatus Cloacimonadota bacterium]HOG30973.1 2-C-methyl-D-erythritol 4-phosphate cytidylyltransferase [Candidatus Cloacimonadota bacterium]HOR57991.1 2-C-methyl-D-erythritol 4-phosphate cytidylyltransferase [Candidatus Cloacimonadota bacterium]HPB08426.1 2-C-methyl-D-erythritol 4-phosphate cytidylyltransferase [Candidatus Cloacimonadota bacterium]HPL22950.1 2-C-methyl-D-erythritol 4-phosphate cytidylyltransferase [Candidatus Cloacim
METLSTAIVTAAGSGTRMGSEIKKQYLPLGGIPIMIRTLQTFFASEVIDNIIVTAPEDDISFCEDLIRQYFEDSDKPWLVIAGGAERQDSVFAALQQCPPSVKYVFIHDAVRPFISEELLLELYEIVQRDKAVIPVARIKNTIKSIQEDHIGQTIPRGNLVKVFTPQVFSYKLIRDAYDKAYLDGYISTDDSALVEHLGAPVTYRFCPDLNIKITDELDLFFARQLVDNNIV